MINRTKVGTIFLCLIFILGCDGLDTKLRVYNNSERKVFVNILSKNPTIKDDINETLIQYNIYIKEPSNLKAIICYSHDTLFTMMPITWEGYFEDNKKVYVSVIDFEQALTQLNKDTIDTTGITYKLYELSYKDLQKRNWVVVYP